MIRHGACQLLRSPARVCSKTSMRSLGTAPRSQFRATCLVSTLNSAKLTSLRNFAASAGNKRDFGSPIVMQMKDVTKQLDDGRCLLKDIRLTIHDGEKVGVLGANGAGKSSFLNILAGVDKLIAGEVWTDPELKVGYLHQEPKIDFSKSVLENVMDGVSEQLQWIREFEEISAAMGDPEADIDELLVKQAEIQSKIDACDAWDLETKALMIMEALRCPPADAPVHNLSGGERRRVALSRLLIENPQILLLDEPTNHLDATSTLWLQRYIRDYRGTVVLVTHDRYFLDSCITWILEVSCGNAIPFQGNYSHWIQSKQIRLAKEQGDAIKQAKMIQKEIDWLKSTPQHRNSMNKARLKRMKMMEDSGDACAPLETGHIIIPPGPRLGDFVIHADHITKSYNNHCLFNDLSFKLQKGWIVGIVGENGAGKSTLLRMLLGQELPDKGQLMTGDTVCIGHLSQHRTTENEDHSVFMEICGGVDHVQVGDRMMNARTYVAQFNFKGQAQEKKIKMLSGGERNRVHLAKALRQGYNVLLLDEPTNDLDVDTLRALEEALPEFTGCAIVVSHDRYFLNRVCTHILAFEGNGRIEFFDGTFDEYEIHKAKRMQQIPTRLVFNDSPQRHAHMGA